jgi:hypothetical protein
MNEQPFNNFIRRIRNAYGLKQLPEEVLEFLYVECGSIESGSAKPIFESILNTYEKYPTKLHLAINSEWGKWNRSKGEPGKPKTLKCPINLRDEEGPCYDGELFLYHAGEEYGAGLNSYSFCCEDCGRSTAIKSSCLSGRLPELMAKGWNLVPLGEYKNAPIPGSGGGEDVSGVVRDWQNHGRDKPDWRRRDIYGDDNEYHGEW